MTSYFSFDPTCSAEAAICSQNTLYLALDFDGVLHHMNVGPTEQQLLILQSQGQQPFRESVEKDLPLTLANSNRLEGEGRLFDRLHKLEVLLDQLQALGCFSNILIVYATSWRAVVSVDTLNRLLTPRLAGLVAGCLSIDRLYQEQREEGVRGLLMQEWVSAHGAPGAVWMALDDQWRHYKDHPELQCVHTHWRGLDDQAIEQAIQNARMLASVNGFQFPFKSGVGSLAVASTC